MSWRNFKNSSPVHLVHKVHLVEENEEESRLSVQSGQSVQGRNQDIPNPVEILDESEIEALRGWLGACSNPKYNLSRKDSTLKAWQLLIESIISIKKRKTGVAL